MKKTIAVLFGGCSSEHEISRLSAATILRNLSRDKYDVLSVGITKSGRWFLTKAAPEQVENGEWENHPSNCQAFLTPDRSIHGLFLPASGETVRVDAVIPALHGKNGEDGTVQGLLQLSGIPYVGCAALASAVCMDKAVSHTLLDAAGIRQAKYLWFYASDYAGEAETVRARILSELGGYPVFVKPSNAGSSRGITRAENRAQLEAGLKEAARHDRKLLVEEFIAGREVECAVFGGGSREPEASGVGEILAAAQFYDFEAKYFNEDSRTVVDPELPGNAAEQIRRTAVNIFKAVDGYGLARVDFFVRDDGRIVFNEINTMPGFTAISMYPMLWEARGISKARLVDMLLEHGLKRWENANDERSSDNDQRHPCDG